MTNDELEVAASVEPEPDGDYTFPRPEERPVWEEKVRESIAGKRLKWSRIEDTQWELHGPCPHCGHHLSNVVDTDVIASRTPFNVDAYGPRKGVGAKTRFKTQVVCTCGPDLHKKGVPGCGYGRDLEIELDDPS